MTRTEPTRPKQHARDLSGGGAAQPTRPTGLRRLPHVSLVPPRLRRLVAFGWGSGVGLLLDLGLFAGVVAAGGAPFAANLISTAAAVTTVYFLVTRYSFRVRPAAATYVAFVLWYGTSALVVSTVVGLIGQAGDGAALLTKLASVPFTFAANFLFGSWLFSGGAERAAGAASLRLLRRARGIARDAAGGRGDRFREARRASTALAGLRSTASWKRSGVIALVTTLLFAVLVLPFTTSMSFAPQNTSRGLVVEYGLRTLFLGALFAFVVFLISFAGAVRRGSPRHRVWLATAVGSLVVNAVVLALIYPGFWVWDEFYTVYVVRNYSTGAWQGYLTSIYYTFGMFLFPGPMGIVVLQLLIIALVTGYVVSALTEVLRRKRWALLLAVPLLSAPVLLNNLYPLRLTTYAYLLLLLLARMLVRANRLDSARRAQPLAFVGDCLIVGLLAFWRTEGIVLLVLLPVLLVLRGMPGLLRRDPRRGVAGLLVALAFVGFAGGVTIATSDPRYQVTGVVNPLALMLQQPLQSPRLQSDLAALDKVVDVDVLRSKAMVEESPALFQDGVRNDFAADLPDFQRAYIDLVVHNPVVFLDARWRTFLAANATTSWFPQVQAAGLDHPPAQPSDAMAGFIGSNPFVTPFDLTLKETVTRALLLVTDDHQMTPLAAVVWNCLPILAATLLTLVMAAARRRRMLALTSGVVLTVATMVFLTEPAAYSMYLFPVYLAGGVLLAAVAALVLDGRVRRPGARGRGQTVAPEQNEVHGC